MKKIFTFLFLGASLLTYAQQTEGVQTRTYSQEELEQLGTKVKYVPNQFKDNWELSLGIGTDWQANGMFYKGDDGKTLARPDFSFAADINATKWFNPFWGLRGGLIASYPHWDLESYSDEVGYYTEKKFEYDIHLDVLWNLSHQATGYRPNRVYNAILYAGFDFIGMPNRTPYPGISLGLLNKFNIHRNWALNLDLRLTGHRDSEGTRGRDGQAVHGWGGKIALFFGFSYRFSKSEWDTMVPVSDEVKNILEKAQDDVNLANQLAQAEKDAADQLRGENEDLRRELAAREAVMVDLTKATLFFEINSADLDLVEIAHFESYLNVVRSSGLQMSTIRANIIGTADKGTGSMEYNIKLAQRRAEYVRHMLMLSGVSANNITVSYEIRESPEARLDRCVDINFSK